MKYVAFVFYVIMGTHTCKFQYVEFVAVSSNSRWVASCSRNGVIYVLNPHSAELHCELRPHNKISEWMCFDFSPITGFLAAFVDDLEVECSFGEFRMFCISYAHSLYTVIKSKPFS
jgi:hypothetical protein